MATNRMQALSNLADKVPSQQAQAARQRQQQSQMGMRQQLAGARGGTATSATAQIAGGQAARTAGQSAVQGQQAALQQQGQIGQMKIGEQKLAGQKQIGDREALLQQAQTHLANKLNQIDQNAKQRVFDQRLQFSADEARRGFLKQQQLADFAIMSSRSRQDYLDNAQKVEQWTKKQLQLMENNYKSIMQDLQNADALKEQRLDEETILRMHELAAAYKRRIEREKNRAANNRSMWQAGGAIVGGVAGAIFGGGPAGAAAGASIGGAAGGAIGGAVS